MDFTIGKFDHVSQGFDFPSASLAFYHHYALSDVKGTCKVQGNIAQKVFILSTSVLTEVCFVLYQKLPSTLAMPVTCWLTTWMKCSL